MSWLPKSYEPPKTFENAQKEMQFRSDRPKYESDSDRHNEQLFKEHFEATCPTFELQKLPIKYVYDFGVFHKPTGLLHSLIEYKHRKYDFSTLQKWGGMKLSLWKWAEMIEWQKKLKIKCSMFVHMGNSPDNTFYQTDVNQDSLKGLSVLWWDNSKMRNDKLDSEPCVLIPCQNFKLVNFNTI